MTKESLSDFFKKVDKFQNLEMPWTLIMRDPLANSFIAPISDTEQDDRLFTEEYSRTPEEEDHFGITDLKQNRGVGETES